MDNTKRQQRAPAVLRQDDEADIVGVPSMLWNGLLEVFERAVELMREAAAFNDDEQWRRRRVARRARVADRQVTFAGVRRRFENDVDDDVEEVPFVIIENTETGAPEPEIEIAPVV